MSLPLPPPELADTEEKRALPPGIGLLIAFALSVFFWGLLLALFLLGR